YWMLHVDLNAQIAQEIRIRALKISNYLKYFLSYYGSFTTEKLIRSHLAISWRIVVIQTFASVAYKRNYILLLAWSDKRIVKISISEDSSTKGIRIILRGLTEYIETECNNKFLINIWAQADHYTTTYCFMKES
ncbi:hypothetical protein WN51_13322, partial [Melipona quadrifasciata]